MATDEVRTMTSVLVNLTNEENDQPTSDENGNSETSAQSNSTNLLFTIVGRRKKLIVFILLMLFIIGPSIGKIVESLCDVANNMKNSIIPHAYYTWNNSSLFNGTFIYLKK